MKPDAHSANSGIIASPFLKQQPDDGSVTGESHFDILSSAILSDKAATPVSPCLSDLYLVSPPQRNASNTSSYRAPSIRASLTPPPHSEKINRAIRAAEFQLDAAVYDVHRYISRGCSDSDRGDVAPAFSGSPESEYSDDLRSPRVLPDFLSPMTGALCDETLDSFSRMKYRRCILDDADKEDNDVESRCLDACGLEECTPELHADSNNISSVENENPNVSDDTCGENNQDKENIKSDKNKKQDMRTASSVSVNITNQNNSETMELRTLQLAEGKFQVWPPLRNSGLVSLA